MTNTTATFNVKNHSFVSQRGNKVEVFSVKVVGDNGTFRGFGKTVRTFARVCGVEVEVKNGCSFQAPSTVAAAGF